jgi:hypothetical protein
MRFALIIPLLAFSSLPAMAQGTVIGGHFTVSQRLTLAGSPYRVTSDLYIDPGVTLGIDPGVVLRFVAGRGLYVDGTLSVEGTSADPVVFTSDSAFVPGAWAGIGFGTGKSKPGDPSAMGAASGSLSGCWVQYVGLAGAFPLPGQPSRAAGIYAYRSNLSMNSVTLDSSGGDGVYWFCDALPARSLNMQGCTVTACNGDGLGIGACGAADTVTVQGNAFANNGAYPVRVAVAALGANVAGNTFAGNGASGSRNGIAVMAGTLNRNAVLAPNALWYVLGPITVPPSVTLTVSEGDTLLFPAATRLQVDGALVVNGTVAGRAVFAADTTGTEPGFWAGIGLGAGASCVASNAAIRQAGYADAFTVPGVAAGLRTASLFAYQADVSLTGVAFENSGGDGVLWYNGGSGAVARTLSATGCSFSGVEANGIEVEKETENDTVVVSGGACAGVGGFCALVPFRHAPGIDEAGPTGISGGSIGSDASLPARTFHVLAPVSVEAGCTLVLPAGCALRFAGDSWLDVYGTLLSQGTTQQHVTLTSIVDAPAPGAWGGVSLQPGASATLTDTDIQGAGQAGAFFVTGYGSVKAGILANRANLSATRLRVTGSGGEGVFYYNTGTTARSLTLNACASSGNAGDGVRIQRFATGDAASVYSLQTSANGGYGLNSVVSGNGVTLSGVSATGNAKGPVRFPADTLPRLTGGVFSGNGLDDAVSLTGGTLPSTVATPHSLFLEANTTVAPSATLTLSPGAVVTAKAGVALLVYGGLDARGTQVSPIVFRPEGAAAWAGVALMPGSTASLSHVSFAGAGIPGAVTIAPVTNAGAAVIAYQASLSLTDARIAGGGGDGVLLVNDSSTPRTLVLARVAVDGAARTGVNLYAAPANETLSLSDLQVTGCGGVAVAMPFRSLYGLGGGCAFSGNAGGDGIALSGIAGTTGTLARDATLPAGARFYLRSYVTVAAGATLTAPKGTEFRCAAGTGIRVDGTLKAGGAPESPVLFAADSPNPAPGYWQSLGFSTGSTGTLAHVEIRHAGSPTSMPGYSAMSGSLIVTGANVALNGGLIRDGAGSNIIVKGAATTFASSRTTLLSSPDPGYVRLVDDAGVGTRSFGGSTEAGCDFLGFTADAVKNTGAATLYARYCFWGTPDGPAPFGSGSGVQGNVDVLPYASTLVNGPMATLSGPAWTSHAPVTLTLTADSPYFAGAGLALSTGETLATFTAPALAAPYAWDATNAPDGVYTFRLTATDRLGRGASADWSVIVGCGPPHSGDLDASGGVDLTDVSKALRIAAGLAAAEPWLAAAADVRPKPGVVGGVGDGFVRLDDVAAIARKAAFPGMELP